MTADAWTGKPNAADLGIGVGDGVGPADTADGVLSTGADVVVVVGVTVALAGLLDLGLAVDGVRVAGLGLASLLQYATLSSTPSFALWPVASTQSGMAAPMRARDATHAVSLQKTSIDGGVPLVQYFLHAAVSGIAASIVFCCADVHLAALALVASTARVTKASLAQANIVRVEVVAG